MYLSLPVANSFVLEEWIPDEINWPITFCETIRLSYNCNGTDNIDRFIASPSLVNTDGPLAEVVNGSFNTGIIPYAMKIAMIIPIFENSERCDV